MMLCFRTVMYLTDKAIPAEYMDHTGTVALTSAV